MARKRRRRRRKKFKTEEGKNSGENKLCKITKKAGDTFILFGDSGSIITTLPDPRPLTTKKERKKRKETAPL